MLKESLARIEALPAEVTVLDVGGWARPLARANAVLDLMPYATRGLYGADGDRSAERFTVDSWVQHDICSRVPFPYDDDAFDLVVCSHTLEDIRDPIWVVSELSRIGRAGYVEVPSRLEEQSWGVNGNYVGWSHHHWLVDVDQAAQHIDFTFKLHALHQAGGSDWTFSSHFAAALSEQQRVNTLWWEGELSAREQLFDGVQALVEWLKTPVGAHFDPGRARPGGRGLLGRRLRRARSSP